MLGLSLMSLLNGCASTDPVVVTQVEVQRIPQALTVPCPVSQLQGSTYQSALELALALKADLAECNRRMEDIRAFSAR